MQISWKVFGDIYPEIQTYRHKHSYKHVRTHFINYIGIVSHSLCDIVPECVFLRYSKPKYKHIFNKKNLLPLPFKVILFLGSESLLVFFFGFFFLLLLLLFSSHCFFSHLMWTDTPDQSQHIYKYIQTHTHPHTLKTILNSEGRTSNKKSKKTKHQIEINTLWSYCFNIVVLINIYVCCRSVYLF